MLLSNDESHMSQHSAPWKKIIYFVKLFRIRGISIMSFTVKIAFSVYIFCTFHNQYITIEETVNKKAYGPFYL